MRRLTALLAGLIFGFGLLLAGMANPAKGMANPAKVLAFLDVTGTWDPSLALVMAGAIVVAAIPLNWARKRTHSLLDAPIQLPSKRALDARLVGGSLLFGVGWGLAGLCPGPAVVLLATGRWQVLLFVTAMLFGMWIFAQLEKR